MASINSDLFTESPFQWMKARRRKPARGFIEPGKPSVKRLLAGKPRQCLITAGGSVAGGSGAGVSAATVASAMGSGMRSRVASSTCSIHFTG